MSIEDLRRRAQAGEAAAQYALAAALQQAGDPAAAAPWLAQAVAAGHPGALYTRATQMLAQPAAEMDAPGAAALLQTAVERGGLAAARQLAVLKALGLGVGEDWPGAVELLRRAAQGGHPAALRELGALGLFCGAGEGAVSTLLQAARSKGDAIAALLPAAPDKAGAHSIAEALAASAAAAIAGPAPLAPQTGVLAPTAPRIEALTGLVPQPFCAYLAAAAAPLLEPSAVVDSAQGRASHAEYRTSDGCVLGVVSLDLMLIALHRALCASVGVALDRSELMGVLRYRPGQEYRPHYDFLPPDAADYSEVGRAGQRVATLVLTLKDGFSGGETTFPRLGASWRGRAGDAVFFRNTGEEENPYKDSLHAGAPVTQGEKWILTLWFRARRFWFWP